MDGPQYATLIFRAHGATIRPSSPCGANIQLQIVASGLGVRQTHHTSRGSRSMYLTPSSRNPPFYESKMIKLPNLAGCNWDCYLLDYNFNPTSSIRNGIRSSTQMQLLQESITGDHRFWQIGRLHPSDVFCLTTTYYTMYVVFDPIIQVLIRPFQGMSADVSPRYQYLRGVSVYHCPI